uniref:Uncharacterized protein n=1 Tax=Romanomermis culicivorax TaxID=13658 RepID=A0A915I993_ROMCU
MEWSACPNLEGRSEHNWTLRVCQYGDKCVLKENLVEHLKKENRFSNLGGNCIEILDAIVPNDFETFSRLSSACDFRKIYDA